jgi:transcriptional regulator with XRE-family HTH domain
MMIVGRPEDQMKRTSISKQEISDAIRRLRDEMELTQPEFASRLGVALRTIARWETGQPPHGEALVKLAQVADSIERKSIAECFVAALRSEKTSHYAGSEPELRAWAEGLAIAFRFRLGGSAKERWLQIAERISQAVAYAARAEEEVGDQKSREFHDLHRQLEGALEEYRE